MENGKDKIPVLGGTAAETVRPAVAGTCILFSGVILLFIFLGYRVQVRGFYSGILITEFVLMMLPALLFAAFSGIRFREALRLGRFRPVNIPIVIGIMLFAIPLAALFNILNLLLVDSIFGRTVVTSLPVAETETQLLVNILVIAGSAGLCEEVLFRGVIQRAFERYGTVRSILMAAFLFSLTHLDFQKILGTFVLGALIGYIVYRTNSLYCGMLAHFTNNAVAVTVAYISQKLMNMFQQPGGTTSSPQDFSDVFEVFSAMPAGQLLFVFMIYGFMFLFAAIVFILLVYLLNRVNRTRPKAVPYASGLSSEIQPSGKVKGLLWLLPGLLLILLWFYVQANGFMGMQNIVTETFKYLIGAAS